MWMWSAEAFEAVYSIVRRCYTSGTRNIAKQVLENGYIRMK